MSKENNVAAPADHSKPRERSPYVLGVKPSTWDAQIAAQAGDEPMDYAQQLRAAVETACEGWTLPPGARKTLETALWAPQVSPRATADVERDAARYRWLRERPYSDWKRIAFNTMDDHPFAIRCRDEEIDAAIATTKPGA